ncbi:MAG TPA: hypothetical protein PKH77_09860 [Anaerolineae bacterium]|nr:hypothetical protein [Anaerolineae bacterium]
MSKLSIHRLLYALLLIVLLSGCEFIPGLGKKPEMAPAEKLLPTLSGYDAIEGETLTGYISNLSEGAALLAGHPELSATIAGVDHIVTCYQEIGAVKARVYSNQEEPLEAGAVAVADKKALLDPVNFFRCVNPTAKEGFGTQAITFKPCTGNYTLERDGNTFFILYAGTTQAMCDTLCANLEGCTDAAPQQGQPKP